MRPRILIVSEPGVDGVFRYVESLIRFLSRQDVEVDFAYSDVRGSSDLSALVAFVQSRGGRVLNISVSGSPGPRDALALVKLWQFVRHRSPSVIHAHSSKAGVLARALCFCGIRGRFFYTPHAYFAMGANGAKARVFKFIEKLFGRVGITVAISGTEADYARLHVGVPEGSLVLLPTGIDCRKFRPPSDTEKKAVRQSLRIPPGARVIGTIARYTFQKDPVTLHRAMLDLLDRHENLWFVHVGKGDLMPQAQALVGNRDRLVLLPSFQPIESVYWAFDAFILSSRYEGFSLSALEALGSGLPLFLSRVPGNVDFQKFPFDSITWFEAGEPSDLQRAVEFSLDAPSRSNNHRETVVAEFDEEKTFSCLLSLYQAPGA